MSESTDLKRPYHCGWRDTGKAEMVNEYEATLEYLAEFFADDLVALRQQRIHSFNPPAAFVDRVIAKMVEDGASVEGARMDLADLWPDAAALDDYPRTV